MQWNSNMMTDLLGHLVVFWVNSMPPRYDLIVHHVVAYSVVYCLMFPLPIYGWDWLCLPLIAEFSTIFMNLRWFTKHFAFSDRVQRRMDALFAITWFGTRCPAMAGMLALRFVLHHRIVNELPPRVHIAGTVIIVFINLLHVVWGLFLAKKMMKSLVLSARSLIVVFLRNGAMMESVTLKTTLNLGSSLSVVMAPC